METEKVASTVDIKTYKSNSVGMTCGFRVLWQTMKKKLLVAEICQGHK
jgi:hypothetical protein